MWTAELPAAGAIEPIRGQDRLTHVLIVEPDEKRLLALLDSIGTLACAHGCRDFASARRQLDTSKVDLLVTNVRLGAFNGLHLVQVAAPATRKLVYMQPEDSHLLDFARRLGARVGHPQHLLESLPLYVLDSAPGATVSYQRTLA